MEGWQRKLDVTKVAIALVEALSTSTAFPRLARDSHVNIHGTVRGEGTRVVGGGGEVVHIAVGNFEDGLIYYILVGAASCYYAFSGECMDGESY